VGQPIDYIIQNDTTKRGLYFSLIQIMTSRFGKSNISTLQNGEINEIIIWYLNGT